MSMDYIREYYRVPAKVGMKVSYRAGDQKETKEGVIVGNAAHRLEVLTDGEKFPDIHHPTEVEYLDEIGAWHYPNYHRDIINI